MIDLRLSSSGDLELDATGDISVTDSVVQAVKIRLQWLLGEWRLGPEFGIPYFQDILVKNPNDAKIRYLIREAVLAVDEVDDVSDITISIDKRTRKATIRLSIKTRESLYRIEVSNAWQSTG